MAIVLRKAAAQHIAQSLAKRGHGIGLRLGVKASGCSGFMYTLDYADEIKDGDKTFEGYGSKVIVDQESLLLADGTEIDYQAKGLNWQFIFHNPQVTHECGCGESFSIEK